MIPPEIQAKTRALDELRLAWESVILAEVRARLSDAHAHAWRALAAGTSPPALGEALKRLDGLLSHLAGPSDMSLKGVLRKHREVALVEAVRRWHPLIPAEIRDRERPSPTNDEVRQTRAAKIHGYDLRAVLSRPIETAKNRLRIAVEKASRIATPGPAEDQILAEWERTAADAIGSVVRTALVDATAYADQIAGTSLIRPEYIEGAA